MRRTILIAAICFVLLGCSDGTTGADGAGGTEDQASSPSSSTASTEPTASSPTSSTVPPAYTSEVYSDPGVWLCRPDIEGDACDVDLDATLVAADGTLTIERFEPVDDAAVDCFYVYPTVSTQPTPNSDLVPTDAERRVVRAQAARFGEVCRVFAPMYRQVTLAALFGGAGGTPDRALAYEDVLDAWRHYLAHLNGGRGVVLIGHSQGSGVLRELLVREIDPDPAERDRLVSAILLGTTARVPRDADTGGSFENIPVCREDDQTGCVLSFSTFAADDPPTDATWFGAVRDDPSSKAICTNPAALAGGAVPLDTLLLTNPERDVIGGAPVATPFVRYLGLLHGSCVEDGPYSYLRVEVVRTDRDARPADLGGRIGPQWGLHLLDGNVALGDLIGLVGEQVDAYGDAR